MPKCDRKPEQSFNLGCKSNRSPLQCNIPTSLVKTPETAWKLFCLSLEKKNNTEPTKPFEVWACDVSSFFLKGQHDSCAGDNQETQGQLSFNAVTVGMFISLLVTATYVLAKCLLIRNMGYHHFFGKYFMFFFFSCCLKQQHPVPCEATVTANISYVR